MIPAPQAERAEPVKVIIKSSVGPKAPKQEEEFKIILKPNARLKTPDKIRIIQGSVLSKSPKTKSYL